MMLFMLIIIIIIIALQFTQVIFEFWVTKFEFKLASLYGVNYVILILGNDKWFDIIWVTVAQ